MSRHSLRVGLCVLGVLAVVGVLAGCGSSSSSSSSSTAATTSTPASSAPAAWTMPNGDLSQTRDVGGPINSSTVTQLGVAWKVPILASGAFGVYFTSPVVVNGVVYTQDGESNVYAINRESGKVLWTKKYNSPDVGPNGVTVNEGTVYGATATSAFALSSSTGEQLWQKKLVRNQNEGIDMAPGYHEGTVYVSTVPGN
jgi:outer membrane protein assembly factor BamB